MGISILGSLGAKLGANLVGSIMNKTLPNAMSFAATGMLNPLDRFDSLVGKMGPSAFKTPPARQYTLNPPNRFAAMIKPGPVSMNRISEHLQSFKSIAGTASEIVDALQRFQTQRLERADGGSSSSFGQGLNVDTNAMAQSTGFGGQVTSGNETGPMEMFQKLQEAQQAAQMFELAVKLADIQHQASMSAIRSIRY